MAQFLSYAQILNLVGNLFHVDVYFDTCHAPRAVRFFRRRLR